MSENKTMPTDVPVEDFIESIEHKVRKEDAWILYNMMNEVTGLEPKMWGPSIIGYGTYHYKYESGREGDMIKIGFSPRKSSQSLYIMSGFPEYEDLLSKLGKYKLGKSCLYINKLADVDLDVLKEIMVKGFQKMEEKHGE